MAAKTSALPTRSRPLAPIVRATLAAVGAAVLCGALSGCAGSHARYESYMARGRQYLDAGNLDKAYVEFRNALQIEEHNPDALYYNGMVAERRGQFPAAADFYQAAVDIQPNDDRARARLAELFVLGGAIQQALAVISPGLLEHPDNPDLLAARAAARHQLKDDGDARADAERAVKLAPANDNAIAVLTALALRAGDAERAIALARGAVERSPRSVDLRRILASVYLLSQHPLQAEAQMRAIIALEPGEMGPRIQLAKHFAQAGNLDEAQQVLQRAVADLPRRDGAKLALVDFIANERSRAQGEKVLRDFIAREPDNDDLRLGLGALLQRSGATREALATYNEIIRRDGLGTRGLSARDRVAAIDIELGHESEAKQRVHEVLTENPRDDDALILRANMALNENDPTQAIVDLRAVLHDQPKSLVLQRSLARAYIAKNEPALAEEALRAAMDTAPEDATLKIDLAHFLIETDRALQAVTLLEGAVQQSPQDAQAREALVRAYMAYGDLAAARTAAEALKTLRPLDSTGYELAGLIAHDDGRWDDSRKNLERALELQPGALSILTSLTHFDIERNHGAAAIARLQRQLERDPHNLPLLELLGDAYLQTKDLPHATQTLTRAVTLDPRSWLAVRALAAVKVAAGEPQAAISAYQTALALAPDEPRVVTELAQLYEQQGRVDDAIACYEALYARGSAAQRLAANNLAILLVTYKTDRTSLDRARLLTTGFERSDNAALLDTLGWVRFKRREYGDAIIVLERAADRAPDSKVIRYHLGMTQLRIGEREHARASLEAALSGSSHFSGADEARAALASLQATRSG